jgi:hypothetical protein
MSLSIAILDGLIAAYDINSSIPPQRSELVALKELMKRELSSLPAAEDARDAARLDWLGKQDGRFYNIDKISAIVGSGFSSNLFKERCASLREAIDAAMSQDSKGEGK